MGFLVIGNCQCIHFLCCRRWGISRVLSTKHSHKYRKSIWGGISRHSTFDLGKEFTTKTSPAGSCDHQSPITTLTVSGPRVQRSSSVPTLLPIQCLLS